MSKNSSLLGKSILTIIVTVVSLISFFSPSSPFFSDIDKHQLTAFETSDIHILMCCSRSYRSSIYFSINVQVLKLPLYIYATILNNLPIFFWGWCINMSPFSKWLPDNLLIFYNANLIHPLLEANCFKLF